MNQYCQCNVLEKRDEIGRHHHEFCPMADVRNLPAEALAELPSETLEDVFGAPGEENEPSQLENMPIEPGA